MRKTLLAAVLAAVCCSASAKNIHLDFQAVSVVTFSQATFKALLHRDFVISPDVVAMDRKFTVSVKAIREEDISSFLETVLKEQGIAMEQKNGIYFLSLAKAVPAEFLAPAALPASVAPAAGYVPQLVKRVPADRAPGEKEAPETLAPGDETLVFSPLNRPAEFISVALSGLFGSSSVALAGAVVVMGGTPEKIAKMVSLAKSLDLAPVSVDVALSWVEVARADSGARGVSLVADVLGAKLGVSLGAVSPGGTLSVRAASFQLIVDALNTDSRFRQISNSRIVGDDRSPMSLTVGDETPTISSSGKDNQGNAIQSIVYRPSGVITQVLPKVLGGGRIALGIEGQISSFKPTSTGVSGSPTLIKREVKTGVTLASGEVLLIGGLSDEHSNDVVSRLPLLPSSWGFKNTSAVKTDLVLIVSAKTPNP